MSERRACKASGFCRMTIRYESRRSEDHDLRERMKALAHERRRFGYRRIHVLLRREGRVVNHKKLLLLYREEKLTVRKRGGRKRAIGTRAPMPVPMAANVQRPHFGLGWMTPAEFTHTINPRRDSGLSSRNGCAPQPAATDQNTATQNRWCELKTG